MKQTLLVAMSNQKGGVGKSTVTVLLASYLHYVKDKQVAVIDCDTLQHSLVKMRERDIRTVEKTISYKQLMMAQWERNQKKVYPIIGSSPEGTREAIDKLLNENSGLDLILVDLPGNASSRGIFSTIINMDYVFTPVIADRMVMQSTLSFATAVLDYIKGRKGIPLKNIHFFWNKVDKRTSTEVYDAYREIMAKLDLNVLETALPESKRFDRELSPKGGIFFRSSLFPPSAKLLKGSNIDLLAEEICKTINL